MTNTVLFELFGDYEGENEPIEANDDYQEIAEEQREEELAQRALNCTCGAWVFNTAETEVLYVADCCCGAE